MAVRTPPPGVCYPRLHILQISSSLLLLSACVHAQYILLSWNFFHNFVIFFFKKFVILIPCLSHMRMSSMRAAFPSILCTAVSPVPKSRPGIQAMLTQYLLIESMSSQLAPTCYCPYHVFPLARPRFVILFPFLAKRMQTEQKQKNPTTCCYSSLLNFMEILIHIYTHSLYMYLWYRTS